MPTGILIEARDLVLGYGGPPAVEGVSFDLAPGEFLALLGPNGGGKTTILKALLGELLRRWRAHSGSGRSAGRVPQTDRSRLDYPGLGPGSGDDGRVLAAALVAPPWAGRPQRRPRRALGRVGLSSRWRGRPSASFQGAAATRADRPRPRPGRPGAAAGRAVLGASPGLGRGPRRADRGPVFPGSRGPMVATHDLEQARTLGLRALRSTAARSRSATPEEALDRRGPRSDLRRRASSSCPARASDVDPATAPMHH